MTKIEKQDTLATIWMSNSSHQLELFYFYPFLFVILQCLKIKLL